MKLNFFNNKYIKPFKNPFVIPGIGFVVWMLIFDSNSFLIHNELNNDIDKLNDKKEYYINEITKDRKAYKKLNTEEGIEKFARETYYLKREDEEIYIIEYEDSLNVETNE
ncbi:FtsB family cell division protein [Formosa algae]|uniref:Cell division protein FtsB n=1 Tax=Formosa algae TaxID=225843 RepID=A0A9X0YNB4_9FLAO|nr:septum formation initiator family protein [Formosa algae]MBP1840141.1 cell division protein FtsB [Formosa algae]MDQ0335741.1 cell division protein FtsB [Formosa algae]OEI79780.1 septum formation initiator [Formosa algae]PNW29734.1 septum formation initiator [Formosa algae]